MKNIAWIGLEGLTLAGLAAMLLLCWRLLAHRSELNRRIAQTDEMLIHAGELGRVGMWSLDLETRQLYWSNRVFEIHDRPLERGEPEAFESVGLYHREDSPQLMRSMQRAIQTGQPFEFKGRVITERGETRHVVMKAQTGRGDGGKIARLYGVIMETSHVLQLARSVNDNLQNQLPDQQA